jgi:hypothetical protein
MAATPAGIVTGVYAITRLVPPNLRLRLLGPLGALTCLPFLAVVFHPAIAEMFALMALVGFLAGYQAIANAEFVRLAPAERRGSLVGVVGAALTGAQGAVMVLAGVLAEYLGVAGAITLLGVIGAVVSLPLIRTPAGAENHIHSL